MKRLSWFVAFCLIAFSCLDEPDCFQLNNNVIVLNFKILGGGTDSYPVVSVHTPDVDTVFLENEVLASGVSLPLNPYSTTTRYTFLGYDVPRDLVLSYKSQVQFVSADCGERYVFSGLQAAGAFDSIRVVNSTPTSPVSSNIDVFRCPRTNVMGVSFTENVIVSTVSIEGFGPLYEVNDTITSLVLPLNPERRETVFQFTLGDGSERRLAVLYSTVPKPLFKVCGMQTIINDLAVNSEKTNFGVVTIEEDSIHDLPVTNFEITP